MAYSGSSAAMLSNYSEVLKVYYLPAIQEQLQNENILAPVTQAKYRKITPHIGFPRDRDTKSGYELDFTI